MGKEYASLKDEHQRWISEQQMFFVATAPLAHDGHVNLSPKGFDTFRILDPRRVCYLDLTGSGAETIAHLRENGRITVMFMAFNGRPRIVRIYGRGTVHQRGSTGFDDLMAHFADRPVARAIIEVDIERVRSSCGYTVPLMEPVGMRETYDEWAARKGPAIDEYWERFNATSLDGLPSLAETNEESEA